MKFVISLFLILFSFSLEAGDKMPIAQWADSIQPLTVGTEIPDVNLWTGNGDPVHLKKMIKKRPTVIIFYQGFWSPSCSNQLDRVQGLYKKLSKMGYQIIAISPDSPHKLKKSTTQKHLKYLLLSDYHLEAARSFGLAYRLSVKDARKIQKKYGTELRHVKGEKMYNLPVPGVFIVDTKGRIHFQYVNPDFESQLSPGLLLEAAKMVMGNVKKHNKNT